MTSDYSNEEWRPVVGYEGFYSVSSMGRVRRDAPSKGATPGFILQPELHYRGYHRVRLSVEQRCVKHRVHNLVAAAFIGPRPPGMTINHKDLIKTSNHSSNLEYVTGLENSRHAAGRGRMGGGAALEPDVVRQIREAGKTLSGMAVARKFDVSYYTVKRILSGEGRKDVV